MQGGGATGDGGANGGAPSLAALVLSDLGKRYERHRALVSVSARCQPGTITSVLGPNGAGKSTLLGILATLVRASQGGAHWRGQALAPGSPLRAAIGHVGHEPGLYADLGARANLELFAALHGRTRPDAAALHALLEHVGLAEALDGRWDLPVRAFSRGMQQRLALARALLHEPALLLFDEPSAALDPAGAAWLARHLREERGRGRIVVLVTHDLTLAAALSDQLLFLRRGRLVRTATRSDAPDEAALRALYQEAIGVPA